MSVFPATTQQQQSSQPTEELAAAIRSYIATYGRQLFVLCFGNRRFQLIFVIAYTSQPLLGANLLREHKLMPDLVGPEVD